VWAANRSMLHFLAVISKGLLFSTLTREELNFWTAYYRSLIAVSINDLKSGIPFKPLLSTLHRNHITLLGAKLYLLGNDLNLIEELMDVLISEISSMNEIWSLTRALVHGG